MKSIIFKQSKPIELRPGEPAINALPAGGNVAPTDWFIVGSICLREKKQTLKIELYFEEDSNL